VFMEDFYTTLFPETFPYRNEERGHAPDLPLRACSCAPRPLLSSYVSVLCTWSLPCVTHAWQWRRSGIYSSGWVGLGWVVFVLGSATGAVQGPDVGHMYAAGTRFTPRSRCDRYGCRHHSRLLRAHLIWVTLHSISVRATPVKVYTLNFIKVEL
jgi:hypothetical protein